MIALRDVLDVAGRRRRRGHRHCGSFEVWRFGGLEVWKFGGLEVWRSGGLEVWRFEAPPLPPQINNNSSIPNWGS